MTTPVPTTAAAHLAMVEALPEAAAMLKGADNPYDTGTGHWHLWNEKRAYVVAQARAALEGWEKRPPLRDDEAFLAMLGKFLVDDVETTLKLADDIEAAMFATGPRTGREGGA